MIIYLFKEGGNAQKAGQVHNSEISKLFLARSQRVCGNGGYFLMSGA